MSASMRSALRRLARAAFWRFDPDCRLVATEFDRVHYLGVNTDVAGFWAKPLGHFMKHGWREGRDPNARFSIGEYLNDNPDVAASGVNPFVHYLRFGRHEGRSAGDDLGFQYRIIARLIPLEKQIANAARAMGAAKLGASEQLTSGLAGSRTGLSDLHLTFSQDDYRAHIGGIQLCLQQEDARLADMGRDHLHLYPAAAWPVLRVKGEGGRLNVLLNGQALGTYTPEVIAAALSGAATSPGGERSFTIHSLLGHEVEETIGILEAVGAKQGFFWLHDYASLCAGFHLLRNGAQDCGAPPPDSAACGICIYGPWRARHVAAHAALFAALPLTVVSPAQTTLDFWQANCSFPSAGAVVHPHASMEPREQASPPPVDRPLRVAYVGHPVAHKGWPLFRELVLNYAGDPRYDFHHLGARTEVGLAVQFHDTRVQPGRPAAMREALEALEIDVVLFWPLWRETFSFTVYEAIAAGCAVITGPDSGNVAAVVAEDDRGWVLPEPAAVDAAFASGEVEALARTRRQPTIYDMTLSGMTADLLRAKAET